ncbi:MAG TPA: hypothetical protein VG917_01225 [Patescibacteria group bacterium]|nr:hypothetical protein [Patescibacteria group bacterium]
MNERWVDTGELPPITESASESLDFALDIVTQDRGREGNGIAKLSSYLVEQCGDLVERLDKVASSGGYIEIKKGTHLTRIGRDYITMVQDIPRGSVRVSFDFSEGEEVDLRKVNWRQTIDLSDATIRKTARASFAGNIIVKLEGNGDISGRKTFGSVVKQP